MGAGTVQNAGGFGHLDHESRLPARQIISRADASENAVDGADACTAGRHEAANMGQQNNQSGLPHVGGLAAHVRAGDHQHPALRIKAHVIGFERRVQHRLDHRMPTTTDFDAGCVSKLRRRPIQCAGAFSEATQHVDFTNRFGEALEWREYRVQRIQQALPEQPFALQGALAGRQHLVLELLKLLSDVALGVGQSLPTRVPGRRTLGQRLADFDVVAMHAVVADFETGDATGIALTRFEVKQKLIGIGRQLAQLIEFAIVAIGDHSTIAQQHRRMRQDCALQQRRAVAVLAKFLRQRGDAWRVNDAQCLAQDRCCEQCITQGGQIARPCRAQRDACQDSLDIAKAPQCFTH
ncbi:MAG: hypothetical protein BWZ07_00744 [Alphaproteobacteria bacterium ADurb.BinA280]|nr:MAG: hypothetical protein BWZ07_00744 [Alphaproteobacteria bacterium ADurb.BinA280]